MTWRSAINDCPPCDEDHPFEPEGYDEWLEKVMDEPWVRALEDMVKWTGVWVGTEEQLIGEIKMRVGKEVSTSPAFPSSFEQLDNYITIALEGFRMKDLEVMDYRKLTEEDLEDFDVPEWGPEAPIIVFNGDAAHRPNYWATMCKLLDRGADALPLSILIFTGEDKHFRTSRAWTGTTEELIKKLKKHNCDHVPIFFANCFRPKEEFDFMPRFEFHPENLLDPLFPEDYLTFYRQMRQWAPILKDLKIKVSWEKRTSLPGFPESGRRDKPAKTYWTIEAPRWKKPDDLFINPNFNAMDLYLQVRLWVAPRG